MSVATKLSPTDATDYVRQLVEDKCDPFLGNKVVQHLISKGLIHDSDQYNPEAAVAALTLGIGEALRHLGLNPNDPSTKETPKRYACMVVGELTKGLNFDFFPKCTVTPNGTYAYGIAVKDHVSDIIRDDKGYGRSPAMELGDPPKPIGAYNQMVLVRDIQTMSLCEHHLQTIDGVTHIAYIPHTKVLGLSKFARVADFFARRPQIQERMTEQIHAALCYILETEDVAVVQDATHFCMRARGAMQSAARTQTDKITGRFLEKPALRQEFFNAVRS